MPLIKASNSRNLAGRGAPRFLLSLLVSSALTVADVSRAYSFEIFGIHLFGSKDEEAEDVADPLFYSVTLTVQGGDEELKETLEAASVLVSDKERPVSGSLGLLSKARSDRENLIAALYADARYDGVVTVEIAGQNVDDLPPDAEFNRSGPVSVAINIDPGAVFTLGDIRLDGDAADLAPARFGLVPGGDAGSDNILKAETLIVRALKEGGRPLAKITGREVVADHATTTLDVTLVVAAGPVAGYGEVSVEGTETVDREFTEYMAGLERGKTYSPEEIDEARERLVNLGVFSSVTLTEAEALNAEGQIPINVEVSERKHRYYGVGATVSNTEGIGLEGYWGHRNLFGRAEKLRIEGSVSRIGDTTQLGKLNYSAGAMFEKPGVIGPDSKFFANLKAVSEHPQAYDRFSVKGGVGLSYELTRTQTVSAELALDYSKIQDVYDEKRHLLVSIPLQYVFDNRDDRLDPKKGFRALAYVEPTYDILTGAAFLKIKGDASAYRALDEAGKFVIAGRVAAGSILGAGLADVPADRRFYSGGGGSVRGYAYQGIGPKDINGVPTGGLSFAETSIELRVAATDTIGVVGFIDVGTVSQEQFPDFSDIKAGAGIGLRYLTPFGPLRIDAAVPLNRGPGDPSFGIYAGVGQAF